MSFFLDAKSLDRLPVSLITGFLGSGKTTLLNHLVQQPEMANTAVLINEFGDVALDQMFIEKKGEDVMVMPNGCLCCSVQGDFEGVIGSLFARRGRGEVSAFERLVIETTGLADPTAIIELMLNSPLITPIFALDSVIATADAVNVRRQLAEHAEALTQVAVADRIVVTKTDLAGPGETRAVEAELSALNASAEIITAEHGRVSPARLFGGGIASGGPDDPGRWLGRVPDTGDLSHHRTGGVSSFTLSTPRPLEWKAFSQWLTTVKTRYAEQLLRVKGIVQFAGETQPVAVHGVHHVFHPPTRLATGFEGAPGTRMVFIVKDAGLRTEIGRLWLEMLMN